MPVVERWAYLDHAAVAPISGPAQEAIGHWADQSAGEGDTVWASWARRLEDVRGMAASLMGAEPGEVALVPNTTLGISLVAEGFPWEAGDNVVILEDEFPSNQYPWLNLASLGVETRRLPTELGRFDLDRLNDLCDARTRIVALSWVGYSTGFRCDPEEVAEVAHRHGALLLLDGIQALGVFPLDVHAAGVDFLAADGHKWLLGPEGAGVLYIRREHLDLLRPLGLGWNSVRHDHDFTRIELDLKRDAARYEGGSPNMPGFHALGASLELLLRYGPETIARRILDLTADAARRLEAIGARIVSHLDEPHRSGIITFELPTGPQPQAIRQHCLRHGVALACRAGRLRISPHAYNDEGDLDKLVEVLKSALEA